MIVPFLLVVWVESGILKPRERVGEGGKLSGSEGKEEGGKENATNDFESEGSEGVVSCPGETEESS